MFGHFQRNTQILRLIRLEFGWEESDKSGVMGGLCRVIRHLGSGMGARLRRVMAWRAKI
jgi:hypothetical protein